MFASMTVYNDHTPRKRKWAPSAPPINISNEQGSDAAMEEVSPAGIRIASPCRLAAGAAMGFGAGFGPGWAPSQKQQQQQHKLAPKGYSATSPTPRKRRLTDLQYALRHAATSGAGSSTLNSSVPLSFNFSADDRARPQQHGLAAFSDLPRHWGTSPAKQTVSVMECRTPSKNAKKSCMEMDLDSPFRHPPARLATPSRNVAVVGNKDGSILLTSPGSLLAWSVQRRHAQQQQQQQALPPKSQPYQYTTPSHQRALDAPVECKPSPFYKPELYKASPDRIIIMEDGVVTPPSGSPLPPGLQTPRRPLAAAVSPAKLAGCKSVPRPPSVRRLFTSGAVVGPAAQARAAALPSLPESTTPKEGIASSHLCSKTVVDASSIPDSSSLETHSCMSAQNTSCNLEQPNSDAIFAANTFLKRLGAVSGSKTAHSSPIRRNELHSSSPSSHAVRMTNPFATNASEVFHMAETEQPCGVMTRSASKRRHSMHHFMSSPGVSDVRVLEKPSRGRLNFKAALQGSTCDGSSRDKGCNGKAVSVASEFISSVRSGSLPLFGPGAAFSSAQDNLPTSTSPFMRLRSFAMAAEHVEDPPIGVRPRSHRSSSVTEARCPTAIPREEESSHSLGDSRERLHYRRSKEFESSNPKLLPLSDKSPHRATGDTSSPYSLRKTPKRCSRPGSGGR